jgi:hypothetical protein
MPIDPRVIKVSIEVDGQLKIYDKHDIKVSGTKYANKNQNECVVEISNIAKDTRNYILSETSPFNAVRKPKRIIVEVGRVGTGLQQIFIGDIVSATVSQPPDIVLTMRALTGNFQKGNIVSKSGGARIPLSALSKTVADDLGVGLRYEASEKTIGSYSYCGSAEKQIAELEKCGMIDAYLDDQTLVVKDMDKPLSNEKIVLNKNSGLIGLPETTEKGVRAVFLLENKTKLGGVVEIQSEINPAINGDYVINKLAFDASNFDLPFYWIAEGTRL